MCFRCSCDLSGDRVSYIKLADRLMDGLMAWSDWVKWAETRREQIKTESSSHSSCGLSSHYYHYYSWILFYQYYICFLRNLHN